MKLPSEALQNGFPIMIAILAFILAVSALSRTVSPPGEEKVTTLTDADNDERSSVHATTEELSKEIHRIQKDGMVIEHTRGADITLKEYIEETSMEEVRDFCNSLFRTKLIESGIRKSR